MKNINNDKKENRSRFKEDSTKVHKINQILEVLQKLIKIIFQYKMKICKIAIVINFEECKLEELIKVKVIVFQTKPVKG